MERQEYDRKEGQFVIAILRNGEFSDWYDSFVVGSSVDLRLNLCAKNPPLSQAVNH